MSDRRREHSDECSTNKCVCLVHSIQKNLSTMADNQWWSSCHHACQLLSWEVSVGWIRVILACLHCVQGSTWWEIKNQQIGALGLNSTWCVYIWCSVAWIRTINQKLILLICFGTYNLAVQFLSPLKSWLINLWLLLSDWSLSIYKVFSYSDVLTCN